MDIESYLQWPGLPAVICLVMACLLLLASAMISASEVAFFSLSPRDIDRLDDESHPSDSVIARLLSESERLMAAILIGNNLVNVAIIMLFTFFLNHLLCDIPGWLNFLIQSVILTFLLLLFGEILPKVYASHNSLKFSRVVAPVMSGMVRAFGPAVTLLVRSTGVMTSRLAEKIGDDVTIDDLSDALKLTPHVRTDEKRMLEGIIEFGDKSVKDAMTSRSEMITLDIKTSFSEVLRLVVEQNYSRVPVYEETEDHIKGILYIKDLLPYLNQNDGFRWQQLVRPAFFVPENKMIDDLLDDFRSKRLHMAIVVDEFGGTSGLITMEDVLEEIVGEIRDEYDDDNKTWQKVGDKEWIFEARTSITDFCKVVEIDADDLGDKADNCESIGGLILEIKQKFPKVHEVVRYRNLEFTVLSMERRRIDRVKVMVK